MRINKQSALQLLITAAFFLFVSITAQAEDYASGHKALQLWNAEAQANTPQWIKVWLMIMMVVFTAGLLFVWKYVEARWLVGGVILGFMFSTLAVPALGWTPLSGLAALTHIVFWSPALFVMLKNRPFMQGFTLYNTWTGLATACILFSFIFDIRDSVIYLLHVLS